MEKENKLLIVDDHKIFREGLTYVISQMKGFKIIGEASNGYAFLEMIDNLDVDIVLMDISMPGLNGIDATSKALEKHPDLKVIALSMFCDKEYYYQMIHAGVSGFILKESGKEELEKALNAVAMGEKYFSQKLLQNIILHSNINRGPSVCTSHKETKLTRTEAEILNLICKGLSNADISEKLFLSIRTIETYKSDIISKTGVKNPVGLVVFALRNHLIDNQI